MSIVLTLAGVALVAVGLWDMFQTLFHPKGQGSLSSGLLAAVWRATRVLRSRVGHIVGPAAMVGVIVMWVALQIVGWALIYYPHLPEGFEYSSEVEPATHTHVLDAFYISMVTVSTLGYGDLVPTQSAPRILGPLQAITGFALLTAALTWFSQIFPPLARRRSLALDLRSPADADFAHHVARVEPDAVCRTLESLMEAIGLVRVDLTQHAEVFYFLETDHHQSLSSQLPYALRIRDAALERPEESVRLRADQLSAALEKLTRQLHQDFRLPGEAPQEVIDAYAAAHSTQNQG
ncbi:potassium channel family protein [Nesterenkonia sphaerica]|uniref:Two pore domain potassium channel family protein n=1 Tax=Nesterenkonia sphaerica TaxID=1804988 RepID=A0A5R9A2J3_9MICC|nr:potassium channel family protein [Nesterenkonia sphaerica]TLP72832.1 two pore domain potassium channel family protein [Nesterenkonia sphaerica]